MIQNKEKNNLKDKSFIEIWLYMSYTDLLKKIIIKVDRHLLEYKSETSLIW